MKRQTHCPSVSCIYHKYLSTSNDSPVAGIHNKRRNGRVCRLFGCRQEFTGEYPCGKSVLNTSDISLSTGKGRHTSTRREMVLVDGSGVLIDTPGVREFGLAIDNPDSLAEMFEISDYAESCRFSDCKHIDEPGWLF